mmetsp:Transcript_65851/g.157379  ORF Transcript_65851/g.157379 Transcript_65851/m.157379 type:complete len:114 (+) Transcript_65851:84-425(+)
MLFCNGLLGASLHWKPRAPSVIIKELEHQYHEDGESKSRQAELHPRHTGYPKSNRDAKHEHRLGSLFILLSQQVWLSNAPEKPRRLGKNGQARNHTNATKPGSNGQNSKMSTR